MQSNLFIGSRDQDLDILGAIIQPIMGSIKKWIFHPILQSSKFFDDAIYILCLLSLGLLNNSLSFISRICDSSTGDQRNSTKLRRSLVWGGRSSDTPLHSGTDAKAQEDSACSLLGCPPTSSHACFLTHTGTSSCHVPSCGQRQLIFTSTRRLIHSSCVCSILDEEVRSVLFILYSSDLPSKTIPTFPLL